MYLYSHFGGLSRRACTTGLLHSMCGHTYKLFESSSAPIAIFSEQTQKHCKKRVVMYKSGCDTRAKVMYKSGCDTRARQHSIRESLHGILPHMLWVSGQAVQPAPLASLKLSMAVYGQKLDGRPSG